MHQASNFVLPKVYRPTGALKSLGPVGLTLLLTLGVMAVVIGPDDRWVLLVLLGVFLLTLAITAWLLFSQRLEVSAEGLAHIASGYRVHSTWDNLIGHANRVLGCAIGRSVGAA